MTYLQKKLPGSNYDDFQQSEKPDTPVKKKRSQAGGANKYRYLSHHGENSHSQQQNQNNKPPSLPRVNEKKPSIKNQ